MFREIQVYENPLVNKSDWLRHIAEVLWWTGAVNTGVGGAFTGRTGAKTGVYKAPLTKQHIFKNKCAAKI